jgi:hypothetical protein
MSVTKEQLVEKWLKWKKQADKADLYAFEHPEDKEGIKPNHIINISVWRCIEEYFSRHKPAVGS